MKRSKISRYHPAASRSAFTLFEVMIASAILTFCLFAILSVISSCLRNARMLQDQPPDAGSAAAILYPMLATTNQVPLGQHTLDMGDAYKDFDVTWDSEEKETNGLYEVEVEVRRHGNQTEQSRLFFLVYNPASQQSGGLRGRLR